MNFSMIVYILGWILNFEALFMLIPLAAAILFGDNTVLPILLTMGMCAAIGLPITRKKPKESTLHSRDGYVIVSLSWIILSVFGALPFVFSGAIPNYIDALFETVSGFTTTGASILSDVEAVPKSLLIWRSFTHWIGGMGVLVFIMAFLPLSGGQNMHIMKAESPGPSVSKLVPRIKTTALLLYAIYFVLTLIEFILLLLGGMTVFDALNISFATAGTGGFAVKNNGLAPYSETVRAIVTVFMILFSLNFNIYFLIFSKKFKDALRVSEIWYYLVIIAAATGIITVNIKGMFPSTKDAFGNAIFTVSSIISSTGFTAVDFNLWPEISRTILVLLMFIGACAGSTGGGIKVYRIVILFKSMGKELHTLIHPKQVKKIRIDSHEIEHEVIRSVNVFMVCFILVFVISLLCISFEDYDMITNFTAVATTINNIGPGLELVGPTSNFAFFSPFSKLVLIFDMLAGRLELFPMLLLFAPVTWKK
ncbi:MAG: TrkH family potassium uptake protein [Oscillospiraceae bacterium]|nr:TrkH family potassium uptake protein [Oscillospiraceae bacterium]